MSWNDCHPVTEADHLRWQAIQSPIMEALKFEGCTVMVDKVWPGLYLKWSNDRYTIKIDVEDAQSLAGVKYHVVKIKSYVFDEYPTYDFNALYPSLMKSKNIEHSIPAVKNRAPVKMKGCVKTIDEVKRICNLLVQDELRSALEILFLYEPVTGKNRDAETVAAIIRGDVKVV